MLSTKRPISQDSRLKTEHQPLRGCIHPRRGEIFVALDDNRLSPRRGEMFVALNDDRLSPRRGEIFVALDDDRLSPRRGEMFVALDDDRLSPRRGDQPLRGCQLSTQHSALCTRTSRFVSGAFLSGGSPSPEAHLSLRALPGRTVEASSE